jgi:hypothetical protein
MKLELTDFKESYMCDGAVILFKQEASIQTIEKIEQLLKDIANDKIRRKLNDD